MAEGLMAFVILLLFPTIGIFLYVLFDLFYQAGIIVPAIFTVVFFSILYWFNRQCTKLSARHYQCTEDYLRFYKQHHFGKIDIRTIQKYKE